MTGEVYVPPTMPVLVANAAKTNYPGSASQLARPAADALNHIAGNLLRGPFCAMHNRGPAASTSETGSVYTYRHPNCDHVLVWCIVGASAQSDAEIQVQAGTGAAVTRDVYFPGLATGTAAVEIVAPWGNDSGYQEVVVTCTNIGLYDVMMWEVPRSRMDAGENCCEMLDGTYPRGGLGEGHYMIQSSRSGFSELIAETTVSWGAQRRQCLGWWGTAVYVGYGAGETNPFGTYVFRHQARRKKTETTRDYRFYAHTWVDSGTTGVVKLASSVGADSGTSTDITHTTGAWTDTPVGDIAVSASAEEDLTFTMEVTDGTGSIYCDRLSILEDDP